jgi:putative oxidoreductase
MVCQIRQQKIQMNNESTCCVCAGKAYQIYTDFLDCLKSPFLLIVRLYWGWQFFVAGKGKLVDLEKVAGYFQELGIPFAKLNALMAGSTEMVGGLLLLLGLESRLVSVPLAFVMLVAYATAEQEVLKNLFSDPDAFVTAAPFQFLFAVLLVLVFGPGKFSLDACITWKRKNKNKKL